MLAEVKKARQVAGEGFRRWFMDSELDLIVWYSDESQSQIDGFQFCYDKTTTEHAVTWRRGHGIVHHRVDDGELPFSAKMSPTLTADGTVDIPRIKQLFLENSIRLEPDLAEFVASRLMAGTPE
ncbi:MAG: hypothetical protein EA426_09250 [Spirochaetaceae bacterium]|nr:MAG: hypothetical protein EA426_09250 [Spirochaetaceae bacterium]